MLDPRNLNRLKGKFPKDQNREFSFANRESFSWSSEFFAPDDDVRFSDPRERRNQRHASDHHQKWVQSDAGEPTLVPPELFYLFGA